MKNLHQRLQTVANISIIVVALLVAGLLVTRYWHPSSSLPAAAGDWNGEIEAGTKIRLADVEWSDSDRTLLLVLSTQCRYCTASLPFYKKLTQLKNGRADLRIIAVLPQDLEDSGKYLSERGIAVDQIEQATLAEISVRGTPTLIEVNRSGTIVRSWVGKLPPEKETEVISAILGSN